MKKLFPNEIMARAYPAKCLMIGWVAGVFMLLSSVTNAQCDIEVSGVLAYCNAVHGNGSFPGFFIGFRIKSIDGDTLNVVDLAGNVPTNLGKRINDINNEFEPSDTTRVRARIAGGADSLEYWYFGPFMDGDSFNIVLIDPDGICDTVEVASGTFTCEGQDPNACDEDVPLYSLDFSQSQWEIGGGGGVNENVDQVFLVMQRSRVATCCQTGNERCFEFIITLDDDDIGLLIDDVGNGSTGGHIYADSLNGFACGTTQQNTWPWFQDNGQSADEPLCLSGSAREWIVLSCKQGNNVTGVSIGTVGELNVLPEYVYEDCTVQLEVLNASSATWSSGDDPNLDNLINFTLDSLSVTFSYDGDTFGPVTSCDGDTFTYFIAGYPDNACLGADSLLYDTTFVVVYPDFSIWIDSVCIGTDSILLNAILTSGAPNCGYSFIWSTGDTTQSIIVPDSSGQYAIDVIREDLDSLVRDCSPASDIINVEHRAIICLPDMLFECISEPPQDSIELIGIAGCRVNPLVTSFEMSNDGSGCMLDSLIITRYYVVDYDGDTINTLTDKDTCIQLFIYVDNDPPVISCPPNITIGCSSATLPDSTGGYASAIDNCDAPLVTYSDAITGGSCPQEYIIIRTWTATDDCGLASTCNQRIAIEDNTPPAIACPANITIQCNDSTLPANTGSATASDICDSLVTPTYTDVIPAGACPYTIRRTWRATDDCGNSSTCLQIITLTDSLAPLVTCPPDITVSCSASTDPSTTGFATGTDNCDVALNISHTNSVVSGSCPQNLIITRTWNVADDCGNITTCIQVITTIDTIAPDLNCPADITIQCNTSSLPALTGSGSAIDNCDPIALITYSDVTISGTCPQELTILRTWLASDDCGNSNTCIQTIQVRDTTPPDLTCPSDITIECTDDTLPASTGFATAADNCDASVIPAYTDSITNGDCPQEYTIMRTWVATDDCGNLKTCIQIIEVRDTTPPEVTCPPNITIECTDDTLPDSTGYATATDNCDATIIPVNADSITNGDCPQEYTIMRTWGATDDCGNLKTCIQIIEVRDTTPPEVTCPPNITIECTDNTLPDSTGFATATDNCDATVVPVYTDNITNGDCPQEITIARTWVATDDCGNASTCVQLINVIDQTAPVITCPADVTISYMDSSLPANTGSATAIDDCDTLAAITYTDELPSTCPGLNIVYRTWVATDDCGNSSSCMQEILIEDDGSICGTVEDDLGESLDSVEIQLIVDVNSNGTYDGGDTMLYSVFTDTAGNYCFTDVKPCNYILREIQPLTYGDLFDYDFTADPDGNDSIDGPDNEIPVVLGQGESDNDNNFIEIVCATVLPVIPPDTICDGGVVVFETVPMNPGPLNYTWDFGSGSSPGSAIGIGPHAVSYVTTTDNQMGGAIISLTISKPGCPDLTGPVSTVDVNPFPNATISGSTSNLCYFTNRTFQPLAPEIPGATYNWSFGNNAVPLTATGYGPHTVYYTVTGPKTVSLVIHPNEAGAQCPDSSTLAFNVVNCPGNITGSVKSVEGVGIQGVNIRLFADLNEDGIADNNTPIRSVFSTANGSYSMVGLTPASYVIVQTQPLFWSTVDDEDTSNDGDAVMNIDSLDNLIPATVNPNEIDAHNTFTEVANPGTISGVVFIDYDGDNTPDNGEGIAGVVIKVFEDNNLDGLPDNGTPLDTMLTTSAGNYSFTDLPVGNYVLEEIQPSGYESIEDFDASNDMDSVENVNMQDDLIPVTLSNQEHDDHNYFLDEYECTLIVNSTSDSGPGSLRFMVGCATGGDTIILDTSLEGQTILLTSTKIEIDKDLVIISDCIPRITVSSSVPGLMDIGINRHVEIKGLDLVSGIEGNNAAAFYNFGFLKLVDISLFRNPLLPTSELLIRNAFGSELIIEGVLNIYSD